MINTDADVRVCDGSMGFVGVFRALYDYSSQSDQELSIREGDLLLVLEKSTEDEWWKAKKKAPAGDAEEPVGLIPCTYIHEASSISVRMLHEGRVL